MIDCPAGAHGKLSAIVLPDRLLAFGRSMRRSRSSQQAEEASLSIIPRKASVLVTACLYRNSKLHSTCAAMLLPACLHLQHLACKVVTASVSSRPGCLACVFGVAGCHLMWYFVIFPYTRRIPCRVISACRLCHQNLLYGIRRPLVKGLHTARFDLLSFGLLQWIVLSLGTIAAGFAATARSSADHDHLSILRLQQFCQSFVLICHRHHVGHCRTV